MELSVIMRYVTSYTFMSYFPSILGRNLVKTKNGSHSTRTASVCSVYEFDFMTNATTQKFLIQRDMHMYIT